MDLGCVLCIIYECGLYWGIPLFDFSVILCYYFIFTILNWFLVFNLNYYIIWVRYFDMGLMLSWVYLVVYCEYYLLSKFDIFVLVNLICVILCNSYELYYSAWLLCTWFIVIYMIYCLIILRWLGVYWTGLWFRSDLGWQLLVIITSGFWTLWTPERISICGLKTTFVYERNFVLTWTMIRLLWDSTAIQPGLFWLIWNLMQLLSYAQFYD